MSIGTAVRSIRGELDLTQAEVDRRAGLQQSYLSRLENENRGDRVDVRALHKVAVALGVTVDEILIRADVRRVPDREQTLRWRQLARIYRRLPEDRQEDIIAIANTLLEQSQPLRPRVIGQLAPEDVQQGERTHEEELDDVGSAAAN